MAINSEEQYLCAVVIPIYKLDLAESSIFAIKRNYKLLSGYDFYFACPISFKSKINNLFIALGFEAAIKFFPDKFFKSIDSYNKLMMSIGFYFEFKNYKYILILQDDALIISDNLSFWCRKSYAYVGAPWFIGFNDPKLPLKFYGVGNGGLSLRNVSKHLEFLSQPRKMYYPDDDCFPKNVSGLMPKLKNFIKRNVFRFNISFLLPKVNEDIFWGKLVPRSVPWFTVPSAKEALDFAFEVNPKDCYHINGYKLPFGCHAWERYDRQFWVEKLDLENELDKKD